MRAARVDKNQHEIVDYAQARGATVWSAAAVGKGFPDLVVGYRGFTLLWEVKDGSKSPSARKLRPLQQRFFDEWRGHVQKIESVQDAEHSLNWFDLVSTHFQG